MSYAPVTRVLEARVFYFNNVGAVLAESDSERQNPLIQELLDIWRPVYKMAYDATTVYEKRLASNLFHHLNSAADYLLEGGVDGACYQLQAVCDKLPTINEQKENQK